MCKCRVCTVGNWILEKSGEDVWEVWAHKGMDLEYNTMENPTWWSKFKYWLHFQKTWIKIRYMR